MIRRDEHEEDQAFPGVDAYCGTGCFPVLAESLGSAEEDALAYLGRELDAAAKRLIRLGEDMDDVYTEISWQSMADTFPEKFDLRERGTVTPVKNQNPWSTCWR